MADLAGCLSGFVLLAAGGAGKSFVMNLLSECEPSALTVHLRTRTAPELRAAVQDAITSGGPVPGCPGGCRELWPAAFHVLEQELTTVAAGVSRGGWRPGQRHGMRTWQPRLEGSFPGFRELKLLPLTRPAEEEFVASAGISLRHGLVPLRHLPRTPRQSGG